MRPRAALQNATTFASSTSLVRCAARLPLAAGFAAVSCRCQRESGAGTRRTATRAPRLYLIRSPTSAAARVSTMRGWRWRSLVVKEEDEVQAAALDTPEG